jgi:hypothetical protein
MKQSYATESEARVDRDKKLANTDWTQLPDAERRITHLCVENFRRFRDAVYGAKHQPGWPMEVDWPEEPKIERQEDVTTPAGLEPGAGVV